MKISSRFVLFLFTSILLLSCKREEVEVPLSVDFSFIVQDSNYNVPVKISFQNSTSGAQFYKWSFPNGSPVESDYRNPGYILFTQPGKIVVKLEAWNDTERKEKTIEILLDTVPKSSFTFTPIVNNFSPAEFDFSFNGEGATQFFWQFDGGIPSTSGEKNPTRILYSSPGNYVVKLKVSNHRGRTDTSSHLIQVLPSLSSSFEIVPSFDDDDFEVPLIAKLDNHTISATTHLWQTSGGVLSSVSDSVPALSFTTPGNYSVTYTASNGKQTVVTTRSITVYPNSGLRSFTNVKLGINTAHENIGCFFSTALRKILVKDSVTSANGPKIDICYFGLSSSFLFNKFISPTEAQNWTFNVIPGATNTQFINKQETCSCGVSLTPSNFDSINNGSYFDNISITSPSGNDDFDNTVLPRVVLFKNANGKKGAIKIKQMVNNGDSSYIICDIKIQKD